MRNRTVPGYLLAFLGGIVLLAACSGGSSREAVSLEEYFQRVQSLHEEQELRSEVLSQDLDSQFGDIESLEEALEALVEILPGFLPGFRALLQDTRLGLDEMEPPAVVRDVHADLLDAYTDFEALIDETADQLDGGDADANVLQTFFGDRSGTLLGARFTDIANRLVAIAESEGIALDLSSGALIADRDRPAPNSEPDVQPVTRREPRVEPVDPFIPPGTPTGIANLDRVIDSIISFSGDFGPMIGHLSYSSIGCTLETGIGGPPKCWEVPETPQTEGARVEVFATTVCESEWVPRSSDPIQLLSRLVSPDAAPDAERANRRLNGPRVYGVYAVAPVAEPSDWPAGDYAVVFATRSSAGMTGTTVRIADGGIVSMEFGCGPTPPGQMAAAFANQLLDEPLDSFSLAGTRTVSQIDQLPSFVTEETEPRWQAVIELSDSVGGYSSVLIDSATELVGADGQPRSIDAIEPGQRIEIEGTPLPWSLWRAQRITVVGQRSAPISRLGSTSRRRSSRLR